MAWRWLLRRRTGDHPAVVYLRNIGGGLSVLGLIGLFPSPDFYWWGVGLLYIGLSVLIMEALLEGWRLFIRLIVAGVWLSLIIAFTFGFVTRAATLGISAFSDPAEMAQSPLAGVSWRSEFTELTLMIEGNDTDYSDINLEIKPDFPIAKIGQVSQIPNVVIDDDFLSDIHIDSVSPSGAQTALPFELIASNEGYIVHCEKLSAKFQLKIVMAVVNMNYAPPPPNGGYLEKNFTVQAHVSDGGEYWFGYPDGDYYGARPSPKTISIKGSFVAYLRERKIEKNIDIISLMPPIPK